MELNIKETAEMLKKTNIKDVQALLELSELNGKILNKLIMTEPIEDVKNLYNERIKLEEKKDLKKYWIFESC